VADVQAEHHVVRQQLQEIERVAATLTCTNGSVVYLYPADNSLGPSIG